MAFCAKCGQQSSGGENFCGNCGTALGVVAEPAPDPSGTASALPNAAPFDASATADANAVTHANAKTIPGPDGQTYTFAKYGSRFGGYLLDGLIVGVGPFVIFFVLELTRVALLIVLGFLILLSANFFYGWLMIAKRGGQTIGMRAAKIKAVNALDGGPLSMKRAAGRSAAAYLFIVLGWVSLSLAPILDLLWPLWDEKIQTIHDKMASTIVVYVDDRPTTVTFPN